MIDTLLRARLNPALRRNRHQRTLLAVSAVWLLVAGVAGTLAWIRHATGRDYPVVWLWLVPAGLLLTAVAALAVRMTGPAIRTVARRIERRHPDLDGRLLTAVEQRPGEAGQFSLMQELLLEETVRHSTQRRWSAAVPDSAILTARTVLILSVVAAAGAWWLASPRPSARPVAGGGIPTAGEYSDGVTISPGNVELEKGTALVVLARFDDPPMEADLVLGESAESERRIPMVRSLNDPVFGVTVPNVRESVTYRIDYAGRRSAGFRVTVFEYPSLERSDVAITYPDYTGLPPKRIEDTRRISVVEGSRVDFELQLNKPVASAVLEPAGKGGEPLALQPSPDRPVADLRGHAPAESREYRLILTDSDGRRNRNPELFSVDVLPNRVPELKFVRPRGDLQPSPLEEIEFEATVLDDFGVLAAGLRIVRPGSDQTELDLELGRDLPAGRVHSLHHVLRLEELNAAPANLITWHLWADDIGPDGRVRRTFSDLHFAEVRPFDQVFRQGAGTMNGGEGNQGEQGGGGAAGQQANSQKDIINATWKLIRTAAAQKPDSWKSDVEVVASAQDEVRERTEELDVNNAESAVHVRQAVTAMESASGFLRESVEDPARLHDALAAETLAHQALLSLAAQEFEVSRQRGQQGGSQAGGRQQMQLDQMDLADDERRYETQRQAESPENAARRETNQILNRLQELARRQDDVNERLKELQSALQEAKTPEEREEAERELKRLEEEQRQMLADVDELQQRMERAQDQAAVSDQREALSDARENMQEAAEAVREGQPGQAAASGTRARRQLQEMREELRRRTASGLADDLRQLRTDARDLARRQDELNRALQRDESPARPQRQLLSDESPADDAELSAELENQRRATEDVVKRIEALSEETSASEPLLSRQLYDTARKFATDDAGAVKEIQQQMLREGMITQRQFERMKEIMESSEAGKSLTATSELLEDGMQEQALQTARRSAEAADDLRRNVERAAGTVIGDDTAALQAAAAELEQVTRELEREMEEAGGRPPGSGGEGDPSGEGARSGSRRTAAANGRSGERPGGDPSADGEGQEEGEQASGDGERGLARNDGGEEEGENAGAGESEREGEEGAGRGRVAQRESGGRQGAGRQPGDAEGSEPGESGEEGAGGQEAQDGQEGQDGQGGGQPGGRRQGLAQGQGQGRGGQPGGEPGEEGSSGEASDGEPEDGEGTQPGEGRGGRGGRRGSLADGGRDGESGDGAGSTEGEGSWEADGIVDFGEDRGGRRGGRGGGSTRVAQAGERLRNPITGDGFTEWSDRLRDIEDMIDYTNLRTDVATARERARQMRIDVKREGKKPDWAVVELEIVKPLLEVRSRVREELMRRSSGEVIVPIDRDPVPGRYAELVERYYEELAK